MADHDVTQLRQALPAQTDELGARLHEGDADSFEELFRVAGRRAFALAYRVLNDARLAEEVVQEAFLWLWEHNDRIDPVNGNADALLMTLVHRRAVDAYRARVRRERRTNPFTSEIADEVDRRAAVLLGEASPPVSPAAVRQVLDELPEEQRRVIELTFYEGCTQVEAARRLDLPLGTVKSRTRLAMGRLRRSLGLEGSS